MTTTTDPTTFQIPAAWLPELERRFDALGRRAEKLGVPRPTIVVFDTVERAELYGEDGPLGPGAAGTPTGRTFTVHTITVTGDAPKYDGWTMLAVIDRDLEEPDSPNVVDLLPGVELDVAWREIGDVCQHTSCNGAARGRKKLVVVEHEDGRRLVIGTTCLRDFLGHHSPERIAAWVETLASIRDLVGSFEDDDDDRPRGARIEYRYDALGFLARTVKVIREKGWTSRGAAREHEFLYATADAVADEINWRPTKWDTERPTAPTDDDVTQAEAALAWAVELNPGDSDYLYNVQAVALKGGWRHRDLGIGASIANAYQRELGRIVERERQVTELVEPCFTGRGVITGTVINTDVKTNDFGTRDVMTVLDDRGFKVWGTVPSAIGVEIGDRVEFTATVDPKDETFGWFKRPTKATVIEEVTT